MRLFLTLEQEDGSLAVTDVAKAEVLSKFFRSVFTIESEGIWELNLPFKVTLEEQLIFTETEILTALENL